jgi:hypothetical protein
VLAGVVQWVHRRGGGGFSAADERIAGTFARLASNALGLLVTNLEVRSLRRLARDALTEHAASAGLALSLSGVLSEEKLAEAVEAQLSIAGMAAASKDLEVDGDEDSTEDGGSSRHLARTSSTNSHSTLGRKGSSGSGLGGGLAGVAGSGGSGPGVSAAGGLPGLSGGPDGAARWQVPWLRAESAALYVLRTTSNPTNRLLCPVTSEGSSENHSFSAERGLLGAVVRRREGVSIQSVASDSRLDVRAKVDLAATFVLRSGPQDAPPSARMRSLLLQPLISPSGAVVGVIALANRVADGSVSQIPRSEEIVPFTRVRAPFASSAPAARPMRLRYACACACASACAD